MSPKMFLQAIIYSKVKESIDYKGNQLKQNQQIFLAVFLHLLSNSLKQSFIFQSSITWESCFSEYCRRE